LRTVRLGVAWLVGGLFAALFLGPGAVGERLAAVLPRTQAGPALFSLLATGSLAGAAVLGVVAVLSLLGGRVYCAACCPLGVLQDGLRFLLRRIPLLRRWQEDHATGAQRPSGRQRVVRWAVLAVTAGAAVLGVWTLAVLLEPHSAFGRIAVHLGRPVTALLGGALAPLLERADVFVLTATSVEPPAPLAVIMTAIFLAGLVAMVAVGGRLYCTALCPLGTCLGLLAQAAPYRLRIDADACTRCGLCARRCRSACIQVAFSGVIIDQSTCVVCLDCLDVCPVDAIRYGRATPAMVPRAGLPTVTARRELLAAGSTALAAVALMPLRGLRASVLPTKAGGGPVSPPGSGDRERFVARCTACQLCVLTCPTHVLQPAVSEYGLGGVFQPRLSFRHGFCEYDCQRCTTVCPNGALLPLTREQKQRTQLGIARLYKDRCIVYCRGEACGACVELCPTHAVYSRDDGGLLYPEMAAGACIGCGACEYACPLEPKAIAVHASVAHGRAAPPHAVHAAPAGGVPSVPASSEDGFPF
jgi:ferredoxin